ncbi:MAG: leucine-rich repeat protein, partial [Clostridia bacterium]|nr:leucine-rich repeat protein [Clostridia bacterium]
FENNKEIIRLTLPDALNELGNGALSGCTRLTDIVLSESNPYFAFADGVLYGLESETLTKLIFYTAKNTATSYTVADGITEIAAGAFYGNEYLKYVTIGKDVVTIGDGAFIACTSLLGIYVADQNEAFVSTAKYGDGAVGVLYEVKSRNPDSTVHTAALVAYPAGSRATYVTVGGAFDVDEVKSSAFDSARYLNLIYFETYVLYGGETNIFDDFANMDTLRVCLPIGAEAESFATYLGGEGIEVLRYTAKNAFTFERNTSGYTVTGLVADAEEGYFISDEKKIVKVPLYYNGLPVTELADYAFAVRHADARGTNETTVANDIESVTITGSITIGVGAFGNMDNLTEIVMNPNPITGSASGYIFENGVLYTNANRQVIHTYLASAPYETVNFAGVLLIEVEEEATDNGESQENQENGVEDSEESGDESGENGEDSEQNGESNTSIKYEENRDTVIEGNTITFRGVKRILTGAFNGNDHVKEISMNAEIEEIGEGAFSLTKSLMDILISSENEHYTFDTALGALFNKDRTLLHTYLYTNDAESVILTGVNISDEDGLTHVGARAFEGTRASRVRLPDTLEVVGDYAFKDMLNLKYLYFESSPTAENLGIDIMGDKEGIAVGRKILVYGPGGIDRASTIDSMRYSTVQQYFITYYFENDDVTTRVRYIAWTEDEAFNYTLTRTSDTKGVATIISMTAAASYNYGYGVKEIVVAPYIKKDGVKYDITTIASTAFKNRVEIKTLTLLYSVKVIEEGFIKGAYNIEDIYINDNDNYRVVQNDATYASGIVYTSDMTTLMAYLPMNAPRKTGASFTDFSVPDSVTRIAAGAFAGSKHLTKIRIGANVTAIGEGAFADCEHLNDIFISSANTNYHFDNYTLYNYDLTLLHTYLATGGGNNGVGNYVVPQGVTEIAAYAFEGNDRLEYIRIPEYLDEDDVVTSATKVGVSAFASMGSLSEIFFENLVEIGADAKGFAGSEVTAEDLVNNENIIPDAKMTAIKATTSLYHYTYTEVEEVTAESFEASKSQLYYKVAGQFEPAAETAYNASIIYYSRTVEVEEVFVGKNSFKWGEDFVARGLNIYALYEGNGSHLLEDDEYTIDASQYNKYLSGTYPIIVTSTSNPALSATFNVTVEPIKDIFGELMSGKTVTVYAPQSSYLNHVAEMQTQVNYVPYTPKECFDLTLTEDGYVVNGFNPNEDPCVLTALDYVGEELVAKGDHSTLTIPSYINNTPVIRIADRAFYASELLSVKLLQGVESIGVSAFEASASLKSIELSSTVSEIGAGAFLYLDKLESFELVDNGYFYLKGGALYGESGSLLHTMFNAFASEVFESEEAVAVIEDRAFEGVSTIRYLTVPYTTYHVGAAAFKNMEDLEEIYFCTDMDTEVEKGYIAPDALSGHMVGLQLFGPKGVYLESFANQSDVIYVAWNDASCFEYDYLSSNKIEITGLVASGHEGCSGGYHDDVVLPMYIGGIKVTSIHADAFKGEEKLTSLVIPTSIVSIGDRAFEACTSLGYITIPYSVRSIGDNAFASCSALDEVVFNTDNITLGNDVFIFSKSTMILYSETKNGQVSKYASRAGIAFNTGTPYTCFLTSTILNSSGSSTIRVDGIKSHKCKYGHSVIVIPNLLRGKVVEKIKSGAFAGMTALTSISISDNVNDVGTGTFNGCTNLSTVTISGDNTYIRIENGLIYTADGKTLLAIVDSIAGRTVSLAETTTGVQSNALYGSAVNSLNLNAALTTIGSGAFGGADSLTSITVSEENKKFSSEDGILYNKSKTALIAYPAGISMEYYAVNDGVIVIGAGAFGGAKYLKSVVLPASVSSISYNAFYGASNLIDIQVNGAISTVDKGAFDGTADTLVVTGISDEGASAVGALEIFCTENDVRFMPITPSTCFTYTTEGMAAGTAKVTGLQPHICDHHVNVVVPMYINGLRVTAVGDRAFAHQQQLISVVIPQTVTSIGVAAFAGCKNLTSVYLGDSVSYVASKAFTSTESLVEVFITSPDFKISNDAFYNAGYNDLVVYLNGDTLSDLDKDGTPDVISVIEEDNGVRTAGVEDIVCLQYSVVNGNEIKIAGIASHVCPNGHNRLVIPETIDGKTVTTISNDAFADNDTVVKIYLPMTVKKIGESAFKGASKLYDIAFY